VSDSKYSRSSREKFIMAIEKCLKNITIRYIFYATTIKHNYSGVIK